MAANYVIRMQDEDGHWQMSSHGDWSNDPSDTPRYFELEEQAQAQVAIFRGDGFPCAFTVVEVEVDAPV